MLNQCSRSRKNGWCWNEGQCFIGANGRQMALRQGVEQGVDNFVNECSTEEVDEVLKGNFVSFDVKKAIAKVRLALQKSDPCVDVPEKPTVSSTFRQKTSKKVKKY